MEHENSISMQEDLYKISIALILVTTSTYIQGVMTGPDFLDNEKFSATNTNHLMHETLCILKLWQAPQKPTFHQYLQSGGNVYLQHEYVVFLSRSNKIEKATWEKQCRYNENNLLLIPIRKWFFFNHK